MKWALPLLALGACMSQATVRPVPHAPVVPKAAPAIKDRADATLAAVTRKVQSPDITDDQIQRATSLSITMQTAVTKALRDPTRANRRAADQAIARARKFLDDKTFAPEFP